MLLNFPLPFYLFIYLNIYIIFVSTFSHPTEFFSEILLLRDKRNNEIFVIYSSTVEVKEENKRGVVCLGVFLFDCTVAIPYWCFNKINDQSKLVSTSYYLFVSKSCAVINKFLNVLKFY